MLLTKPFARSRKLAEIPTPPIRLFTFAGIIEIAAFSATLCVMVKDLARTPVWRNRRITGSRLSGNWE